MKYMHMIHCVCLNRAQQWLTAMCLLFSAASEGRIRNLGLGGKIGTFLGPFWYFGPIWDQVPNSGPYRSACLGLGVILVIECLFLVPISWKFGSPFVKLAGLIRGGIKKTFFWSFCKGNFGFCCTSCVALLYRGWQRKWIKVPRRASRHFQRLTSST